jgi:hypothetical protein
MKVNMKTLSRDEFLKKRPRRLEFVPTPELAGDGGEEVGVWVRVLSPAEREGWERDTITLRGKDVEVNRQDMRARLVSLCAVGDDASTLFTAADIPALNDADGGAVERIFEVAMRVNRLRKEDIDDLGKVSDPTRNGTSPSNSP